ncbi:hypothetical protein [Agromyces tropicus]|uniref:hypothetical protein n=1 Tax=Agromyces tropicus TaxID=555371 RepID=UPI0031D7C1BF
MDSMSLLPEERIESAKTDVSLMSPADQKDVVDRIRTANPSLIPTGDTSKTALWLSLIIGVLVVALAAIAAAVILVISGSGELAAAAWPIATAAVAGTVGLFAKSPTG